MFNGKVMTLHITVGLIKKIYLYRKSFFLELFDYTLNERKVQLNLGSYVPQNLI